MIRLKVGHSGLNGTCKSTIACDGNGPVVYARHRVLKAVLSKVGSVFGVSKAATAVS